MLLVWQVPVFQDIPCQVFTRAPGVDGAGELVTWGVSGGERVPPVPSCPRWWHGGRTGTNPHRRRAPSPVPPRTIEAVEVESHAGLLPVRRPLQQRGWVGAGGRGAQPRPRHGVHQLALAHRLVAGKGVVRDKPVGKRGCCGRDLGSISKHVCQAGPGDHGGTSEHPQQDLGSIPGHMCQAGPESPRRDPAASPGTSARLSPRVPAIPGPQPCPQPRLT